jgi:hypothetical protein
MDQPDGDGKQDAERTAGEEATQFDEKPEHDDPLA